jgi:hypothetical protein
LGQLFKIIPNLKQYVVAMFAFGKKKTITAKPNSVLASMVIDPHMVAIHV